MENKYYPDMDTFLKKCGEGNLIPVYREILADLETPVSAFMRIDKGSKYSFLLESVEGGEYLARYSFLGSNPEMIIRIKKNRVTIVRDGKPEETVSEGNPLIAIGEIMKKYTPVMDENLPRFYGGAVGFIGYDMVRFFETLPDENKDKLKIDDAVFVVTDSIIIFDHVNHKIKVVVNAFVDGDPKAVYGRAVEKIDSIISTLFKPLKVKVRKKPETEIQYKSNMTKKEYEEIVRKAKEYIFAGDVFQVVLSQRLSLKIDCSALNIYRALRAVNPSPYMYYLKFGDVNIVGSSPEILVRNEDGALNVRPLAGTRKRGKDAGEDVSLEKELLADRKELAEHLMLLDLGRNDLGRVSEYGSVAVTERMFIERYSHVMHIVSNVVGKLKNGCNNFDVIKACFPAGTVSGAPKIRAMEIIEELEPEKRGVYAGSIGYFSFSGNLDTCIAIRTLVIIGKKAYVQAGAGIVADSDPETEYYETLNKAKAMLKAIEFARKGLE